MRPRSIKEMHAVIALTPCPSCGARIPREAFELTNQARGADKTWIYRATCPSCGSERELRFDSPAQFPPLPPFAYGGDQPSTLITLAQFRELADEFARGVSTTPESLEPPAFFADSKRVREAIGALEEARKLAGGGELATIDAELDDLRALRARYKKLVDVMNQKNDANPPPTHELTEAMVQAHERWIRGGRRGPGRLELEDTDVSGRRFSAKALSGARFARCRFDGADFSFTRFEDVEFDHCTAVGASMSNAPFANAHFVAGDFSRCSVALSDMPGARLEGTVMHKLFADRLRWNQVVARGLDLREATLSDATFDGAVFEDCDFRGANLARVKKALLMASTRGTRFVRCDLRGARLDGRRLEDTEFVDCKLHGTHGVPAIEGAYTAVRPDFSSAGDGSDIRDTEAVYAVWGRPA